MSENELKMKIMFTITTIQIAKRIQKNNLFCILEL